MDVILQFFKYLITILFIIGNIFNLYIIVMKRMKKKQIEITDADDLINYKNGYIKKKIVGFFIPKYDGAAQTNNIVKSTIKAL